MMAKNFSVLREKMSEASRNESRALAQKYREEIWSKERIEMKLLYCPECHDICGLTNVAWRLCFCGASGGQYNRDGMTATVGGKGRIFGIGNPFFDPLYVFLDSKGKKEMQQKFYGHSDGDCWWGEYCGDQQIFRIEDAKGPALEVKMRQYYNEHQVLVRIVDSRSFSVAGVKQEKNHRVLVPANPLFAKVVKQDEEEALRKDRKQAEKQAKKQVKKK